MTGLAAFRARVAGPAVRTPAASLRAFSSARLAWGLGGLVALWLLLPALMPCHVEGFSASLPALALHLKDGTLAKFDLLQPLNTEYLGLTKLGAVVTLSGLMSVLPIGAELASRLMMWGGLAALLGASAFLVRRWSGGQWRYALPALLLVPGVVESAFFYNDNVLSAGLAALALCLLYGRTSLSAAAAGALFGLAVLTRADTVLACVAAPVILWERFGLSRAAIVRLALLGLVGAITLLGTLAMFHASLFDVVRIGAVAVETWHRPPNVARGVLVTLFFFGLAGLLLALCGVATLARRREFVALLRLCAPAVLLVLVLGGQLWEIRQWLALTPFVCALVAIGLRAVFEGEASPARRLLRVAITAAILISLVGPPDLPSGLDGPRVMSGRLWAIPLWRAWQDGTRRDFARLDALVGAASAAPRTSIVTDYWNEDRYLHLVLLDRGYRIADPQGLPLACRQVAERFVHSGSEVISVRNHQSFVPYGHRISGERFARLSLPCLRSLDGAAAFFVASSARVAVLLPDIAPPLASLSPAVASVSYGPVRAVRLDGAREAALLNAYRAESRGAGSIPPSRLMDDAMQATRARIVFPGS